MKPHFTFQWDFLARYDNIDHLQYYEDISRGRFELRPQVGFATSPEFQHRRARRLRLRHREEHRQRAVPGQLRLAGRLRRPLLRRSGRRTPGRSRRAPSRMPVAASEMLWDQTTSRRPARAASWVDAPGPTSTLTFAAAGFYGRSATATSRSWASGRCSGESGEESRFAVAGLGLFLELWTCATWTRSTTGRTRVVIGTAARPTSPSTSSSTCS